MSAAPRTIEGTWDEVLKHADELAGHRLRVTVLDDAPNPYQHPAFDTSPEAIAAWAKKFQQHAMDRAEVRLADDSRESIYEDFLK